MKIKNYKEKFLLSIFLFLYIKCDLVIIGPNDLMSRYYNQPIEIEFGKISDVSNFYIHGEIYFDNTTNLHIACNDLGILTKNRNPNEYIEDSKILLAYNGQCSVIQKARNAQNAGASMLLLINNNDKDIKDIILDDDGSGNDIKIPIGLISLANGRIMQNYIENNPNSRIMVEINFQKKIPKKKIDVKLFFSSSELRGYQLINNITKILKKFSDVDFIPIYVTHQSPSYDPENPKRELNCVSKGKYCYFPKETTIVQDGQKILMESLRQKCMYLKNEENKKYYYEYLDNFYKNCLDLDSQNIKFNERCAKQTLDSLGYPITYLDECMAESFGVNRLLSSTYIDNENTIFKKDYDEILKYKLTSFPAIIIDDKPLTGIINEMKIIASLCNTVSNKPDFCSYLTGGVGEHINIMNRKKNWIYILIIIIIIINIVLFFIFRKYIMLKINNTIDFNTININKRVNNILQDMSNRKNQEMDYKSFDTDVSTKNNKGYTKIEGIVNSI